MNPFEIALELIKQKLGLLRGEKAKSVGESPQNVGKLQNRNRMIEQMIEQTSNPYKSS